MSIVRSSPSGNPVADLVRGTNLTINPGDTLSPLSRPRRFFDWDYFCTGGTTSGGIGRMGWNLVGSGTPAVTRQSATLSAPNKLLLSTSNATNNVSSLVLGNTTGLAVSNPLEVESTQCVWRQANSLATKRTFFGWNNNFGIPPLTSNVTALGVIYDSGVSPNYLVINKFGNALSQVVDTGVAVPVNFGQILSIQQPDPTNVNLFDFYVSTDDGVTVSAPVRLASVTMIQSGGYNANFGFYLQTLANVVSSLELGYWGMVSRDPISGNLYRLGDAFLEV